MKKLYIATTNSLFVICESNNEIRLQKKAKEKMRPAMQYVENENTGLLEMPIPVQGKRCVFKTNFGNIESAVVEAYYYL